MSLRVQRMMDPVACYCACKAGVCPPGVVMDGDPTVWVEGWQVAYQGFRTSNCCGSCCKCPNYILTGALGVYPQIARQCDVVSCGFFTGGATRTFIGG